MKNNDLPNIRLNINNGVVSFNVSDGWSAEFMGADFVQLVDDNLIVHTPLCDAIATLSFKCNNGSETVEKDCKIKISGTYGASGKKPNIIPEPAQWYAEGGSLSTINSYSCEDELKNTADAFADEYYRVTGKKLAHADYGDVHFCLDRGLLYLGEEGYEIICDDKGIKIGCGTELGAVWAGKTVCQLMLQGGFPKGIMRDYPRYSVRGFMLDVGRRPVSLKMLERIVDRMAWYKMNDFQIHLGDNYIWLEDYADKGDESTFEAYSAFRLESSLKNKNGETPTSKDYSYSKAEFNSFMKESLKKGVRITPEIDMPAHALAFTKVFPEYAVMGKVSPLMKKRPLTDHIDISRPEAVEFVKSIFDEYTLGDDPVFPKGTTVHIGADEFLTDYGAYRRFINEIVPYIKKTNTVRLWGSLTWIKDEPATAIAEDAVKGVQMNLWSNTWADGKEMYDMGYDLINTIDHRLYIVPNGTKIRAPYMDFINKRSAFRNFEPNRVRLKDKGKYIDLPAGNKQILGACYAIWQDNIDKRAKGINEQDLYDRFDDSAALMAEKTWGSCTYKHSSAQVDRASDTIDSLMKKEKSNIKPLKNLVLKGGNSFVNTGCKNLETGSKLSITLSLDEIVPGQIIMEADAPYGTYDIRITENSKLGFTAEGYDYEFDYTLVPNKKLKLIIDTKPLRTVLKTGFFIKKKARGSFSYNGIVRTDSIRNSSFTIPYQRIGSKTNSIKGQIYDIHIQ
ncbi:MAG: family 20 glycosylhydrolase [Eubacterium sp.]|nr:family 20 glycosylhydrolase [Eubacterium sp.]